MAEKVFTQKEVEQFIETAFNKGYQHAYYEQVCGALATPKEKLIEELINKVTQ